ncbi:MAG TPA: DUF3089 domain-containing protein [Nocardioides sp.]|nr:DUF3089 domain-containing protein [Nocardioides sp.]
MPVPARLLTVIAALGLAAPLLATTPAPAATQATTTEPVVWLCRPGLANNPCEIPLDTTYQRFDGTATVSTPARRPAAQRPVDCFYVYPTVSNQPTPNADRTRSPELRSIAKYQAAPFSRHCRVFAPVYRQITLAGLVPGFLVDAARTAYADVRTAWRDYLARHNKGRPVLFVSHSQGTIMLRKLIHDEVEPRAAVRNRVVGGFLMGGNVTVAKGSTRGGDFDRLPVCTRKGQYGCIVAYSSYSTDPLLGLSFFGNSSVDLTSSFLGSPSGAGYRVACTDPSVLSGSTRPVGVTVPSEPFAQGPIRLGITYSTFGDVPTADTTWVSPPDRFTGRCRDIGGAHVFRYDPTPGSRRPPEFPPTWGTHLFDLNLAMDKLQRIAGLQVRAWLAAH